MSRFPARRALNLAAGALCAAVMVAAPGAGLASRGPAPTAAAGAPGWSRAIADAERLARAHDTPGARAALRRATRALQAASRRALRMPAGRRAANAIRAVAILRGNEARRLARLLPRAPRGLRAQLVRTVRADVRAQRTLARRHRAMVRALGRRPDRALDRAQATVARAVEAAAPGALPPPMRDAGAPASAPAAAPASRTPATAAPAPAAPRAPRPGAVTVERGIPYREVEDAAGFRQLKVDAYLPHRSATPRPAVIVVHGGGWRDGNRRQMAREARALAERGFATFAIEYRLDTEVPFPDEVEDVRAAVRWVRANAGRFGVDPARIGALGGSAGGNLAALVGVLGEGPLDRGDRLAAVASWSGPMYLPDIATNDRPREGCTPSGELGLGSCDLPLVVVKAIAAVFIGCPIDDQVPWVSDLLRPAPCPDIYDMGSPALHVTPDDPPLFMAHSESDPMVPMSEIERMAATMRDAGVPVEVLRVPGEAHAGGLYDEALGPTAAFFEKYLGDPED
jgi:acetyl esterase/lipase